jgi:hypothetical protein
MRLSDSDRFAGRLIILYALIAVPLCRFLIQHEHGFLHPEVFVLGLLALLPCVAGALIARKPIYFYAIVLFLIVIQSSHSVQVEFFPNVRVRWIIFGLMVLTSAIMILMKKKFFPVLLIFLGGMLLADTVQALAVPVRALITRERPASATDNLRHVVYIIFDELIGLEGFPCDIEGSLKARSDLQHVLLKNNFTVYPFAFANYRSTLDSIPSILNNRLLKSTGEYLSENAQISGLKKNSLFQQFLNRGYAVRVYQSDYMNFAGPGFASVAVRTYKANSLAAMHSIRMDWTQRLRQILTIYLQTDELCWGTYQALVPARFHPTRYRMGPLAMRDVWPSEILADIKAARQNTLFFAHLLTPHYPYVYRPDGTVRGLDEWFHDNNLYFYRESEYKHWYRNYMEQVEFLARQMDAFFHELRAAGIYDSTLVVIHGDHGSRLRLLDEGERTARMKLMVESHKCSPTNRYDYVSAPKLQDLLNRFSTLLAVKPAGAAQPGEVMSKGSVLFFLRGVLWPRQDVNQGLNSVYLFDAEGLPREIPLPAIWQGQEKERCQR